MSAFVPTHRVPSTGMDSWPRPDPAAPVGPRIGGDLAVQVVDRLGDWAKVAFDNGWIAWVDGRLLVGPSGAPGMPPAYTPQPGYGAQPTPAGAKAGFDLQAILADRTKACALGGAVLLLLSSVLPWIRGGGRSTSSFDVPLKFLFDYESSFNGGIKVGWLLIAAAVVIVVAVVKNADRRVVIGAGIAGIVIAALYAFQLQRLVSKLPGASFTDFIGFGVLLAAAGGALAAFAFKLRAKGR